MVIQVLAKITKMSWFEHHELQSIAPDLLKICAISEPHCLIALQALDDLIIEMGYVGKVRSLVNSRRVSCHFRDSSMFQVVESVLQFIKSHQ